MSRENLRVLRDILCAREFVLLRYYALGWAKTWQSKQCGKYSLSFIHSSGQNAKIYRMVHPITTNYILIRKSWNGHPTGHRGSEKLFRLTGCYFDSCLSVMWWQPTLACQIDGGGGWRVRKKMLSITFIKRQNCVGHFIILMFVSGRLLNLEIWRWTVPNSSGHLINRQMTFGPRQLDWV